MVNLVGRDYLTLWLVRGVITEEGRHRPVDVDAGSSSAHGLDKRAGSRYDEDGSECP